MGVLGQAIARYLEKLEGLYSVELPKGLPEEMQQLVLHANASRDNRALLVTDDTPPPGVACVPWRDVLGWRTTDDRIFTWNRGYREPDTSFRSVVRPFISSRFPGAGGGECTLEQLVHLCICELWTRRGWHRGGEPFNAFVETGLWVTGVLTLLFESAGSEPSSHWSDRFLEHWAQMLLDLDKGLAALKGPLEPRHAWEMVRISGLPLPEPIVKGNPFLKAPGKLEEKNWAKLASLWSDVVQTSVLPEGNIRLLLTALDREQVGSGKVSSWRGLPWDLVRSMDAESPAPMVGREVFAQPGLPSFLDPGIPLFPLAPSASWWGVTTGQLDSARGQLRGQAALVPGENCTGLLRLAAGKSTVYVLNTRAGSLTRDIKHKRWNTQVRVEDVKLRFKEDWNRLFISADAPTGAQHQDAWINNEEIDIRLGNRKAHTHCTLLPGEQLLITAEILVDYEARGDTQADEFTGSSKPDRTLRTKLKVRRFGKNDWDPPRTVESALRLVVPSPFGPTVLVTDSSGKLSAVAPDNEDPFSAALITDSTWTPATTPNLLLDEEGPFDVHVYDGSILPSGTGFATAAQPLVAGRPMEAPAVGEGLFPALNVHLDDGVLISNTLPGASQDIASVKVRQRSNNLSSGLLAAVRGLPAGRKQPSQAASDSLLGQYQVYATRALYNVGTALPNSLYQYVLSSGEALSRWKDHGGTPAPEFLFPHRAGFTLPGLGQGPSTGLAQTAEWQAFMEAIKLVSAGLNIVLGGEANWLSGIDVSVIGAPIVRRYLDAHAALVRVAKTLSAADAFWAAYPFSVLVVESKHAASLGQLQAVLLSPLHPARLAWTFAVTIVAQNHDQDGDSALLQLVEGWNIPCTGVTVTATGQTRRLVAVPTDPGSEQDFVSWSALAVLNDNNLADLPTMAGGLPLPWGGRTGINGKVIERAIRDYLVVHPHLNSLEVEVRSVSQTPRAQEIDEALLNLVAAENLEEVRGLDGGTRVWDSADRLGSAPTRDRFFAVRADSNSTRPFEWRSYAADKQPMATDIAFIENASVHVGLVDGQTNGVVGPLLLKRFAPAVLDGLHLDQNFSPLPGEDLLGLANLLREIETPSNTPFQLALRASPQAQALGIGGNSRWEILGNFNLDPALLSAVVDTAMQTGQTRLLWEWRPSWMSTDGRNKTDLARRPYFVIARIPPSLSKALELRQVFSPANATELLKVLGHRGIGLAALSAQGGTQESAAAGFFYAVQLLLPPNATSPLCAPNLGNRYLGVIPIDAIEPILEGLAAPDGKMGKRADILGVAVSEPRQGTLRLCFVPIEIKHHGMPGEPAPIPAQNDTEYKRAREQLVATSKLLRIIAEGLAAPSSASKAATSYLKRLALATVIDFGLTFTPHAMTAAFRGEVVRTLLSGKVEIGIGDAILLWFAPGSASTSGDPCIANPNGTKPHEGINIQELFIDPGMLPGLWWSETKPAADDVRARTTINKVIESAFAACTGATSRDMSEIQESLAGLLGLQVLTPVESSPPLQPKTVQPTPVAREVAPVQVQYRGAVEPALQAVVHNSTRSVATESTSRAPSEPILGEQKTTVAPAGPGVLVLEPRVVIGWSAIESRWAIIGKLARGDETVALDLDHPKTIGIFGYMGSGKSYLLGNLVESAVQPLPGINRLQTPLAVVVFNYRRNASDRFELASLAYPNPDSNDIDRLKSEYGAVPASIEDLHVLCLPGELRPERQREYGKLGATELYFDPQSLGAEDWELLMGEPGSEAVFARTIRNTLVDLRARDTITLEKLEEEVGERLSGQSRTAAKLRFDFVRRYISAEHGVDFSKVLRPGRVLVVDLRQPLFNKDDALRFFLVCANQISKVQGRFNKLLVFDEAHEYMSNAFGERMESRIRLMRHEGTSYVFATQDVSSIPLSINRFLGIRFVFDLGTRENVQDMENAADEFRGVQLLGMKPGTCFVQANQATNSSFARPKEIRVRPRVTQHGGGTRIFSGNLPD